MIQQLCSMKQKNTQKQTNTNKSTHSEMGPVRQNPIQRTVRTAHVSVLMTVRDQAREAHYLVACSNVLRLDTHIFSLTGTY